MKADPALNGVLVTSSEIADLAGVKRPVVSNWKKRHARFPAPAYSKGEGQLRVTLYWRHEIEEYLTAPKPPRARKAIS